MRDHPPDAGYADKPGDYFAHVRQDVLALIPAGARRLLDVGCGVGATAQAAKQQRGAGEVWGIEMSEAAAAIARTRLDHVLAGDLETLVFPWPERYFDTIVCADVLEHMRDPWAMLRRLHGSLDDSGTLVVSLPNLRHLLPLLRIVLDRFEYEPEGILDRTHLRFFTLHTMRQMLESTGFAIRSVSANRSRNWKYTALSIASLGRLRPFFVYQYLFVAAKRGGGPVAVGEGGAGA